MKAHSGVYVCIHIFLSSALDGGERSASRPDRFIHGTNLIGGCVGPGIGLDLTKRKILPLAGIELRPAHSRSLHGLRYPHSCTTNKEEAGFKLGSYDVTINNVVTHSALRARHNELNSRGRLETCVAFE
jgi:hypothetical protein